MLLSHPTLSCLFFFLLCCRFLLSVITSLVKKDPPELEAVLSKIKQLKGIKLSKSNG